MKHPSAVLESFRGIFDYVNFCFNFRVNIFHNLRPFSFEMHVFSMNRKSFGVYFLMFDLRWSWWKY